MLKILRNVMLFSVAASFFVACAQNGDSRKRVRLPMRQDGGLHKPTGTGPTDGAGTNGTGKVGIGTSSSPTIDVDKDNLSARQSAYDKARAALNAGSSTELKALTSGTYTLTDIATEYLTNDNRTIGVLSIHHMNADHSLTTETLVEGTVDGKTTDADATSLNIASQFDLSATDKLEVSNVTSMGFSSRVDLTKPQLVISKDVNNMTLNKTSDEIKGGANSLDLISQADIAAANPVSVEAFDQKLGKKAQMTILSSGDSIRMRVTVELGNGPTLNIYITYKLNKAAASSPTKDSSTTTSL